MIDKYGMKNIKSVMNKVIKEIQRKSFYYLSENVLLDTL